MSEYYSKAKTIEQVRILNIQVSMIEGGMSYKKETKVKIAMKKERLNKNISFLYKPLDKKLREILMKCFIWSVTLYKAETWPLRKDNEKILYAMKMWI